jgi:hypothetical protein
MLNFKHIVIWCSSVTLLMFMVSEEKSPCPYIKEMTGTPRQLRVLQDDEVGGYDPNPFGGDSSKPHFLADIFTCEGDKYGGKVTTECMTGDEYDHIIEVVERHMTSLGKAARDDFIACGVRLEGHDFLDFREGGGGGSDACFDLNEKSHTGLQDCTGVVNEFWNVVNKVTDAPFCKTISLADFIVVVAEAIMHLRTSEGMSLDMKSHFKFGRTTIETCEEQVLRLPDTQAGCPSVQTVLQNPGTIGMSWTQIAAITGVHTLGKAELQNSGHVGFWSDEDNQGIFNNNFYRSMLLKGWKTEVPEGSTKFQFTRADVGRSRTTHEFMLNSDLCLVYDLKNGQDFLSHEMGDCCLMANTNVFDGSRRRAGVRPREQYPSLFETHDGILTDDEEPEEEAWRRRAQTGERIVEEQYCGVDYIPPRRANDDFPRSQVDTCCDVEGGGKTCTRRNNPKGPAYDAVHAFAANERVWLDYFRAAWLLITTAGYEDGVLKCLGDNKPGATCEAGSCKPLPNLPDNPLDYVPGGDFQIEPTPPKPRACHVCHWDCQRRKNWKSSDDLIDWSNLTEDNCAKTAGDSTCHCWGGSLKECFKGFKYKKGNVCADAKPEAPACEDKPEPTTTPAPEPPTTQAPPVPLLKYQCTVCHWGCDNRKNWKNKTGKWANKSPKNCAKTNAKSNCHCFGLSLQDCFDSFDKKKGNQCKRAPPSPEPAPQPAPEPVPTSPAPEPEESYDEGTGDEDDEEEFPDDGMGPDEDDEEYPPDDGMPDDGGMGPEPLPPVDEEYPPDDGMPDDGGMGPEPLPPVDEEYPPDDGMGPEPVPQVPEENPAGCNHVFGVTDDMDDWCQRNEAVRPGSWARYPDSCMCSDMLDTVCSDVRGVTASQDQFCQYMEQKHPGSWMDHPDECICGDNP